MKFKHLWTIRLLIDYLIDYALPIIPINRLWKSSDYTTLVIYQLIQITVSWRSYFCVISSVILLEIKHKNIGRPNLKRTEPGKGRNLSGPNWKRAETSGNPYPPPPICSVCSFHFLSRTRTTFPIFLLSLRLVPFGLGITCDHRSLWISDSHETVIHDTETVIDWDAIETVTVLENMYLPPYDRWICSGTVPGLP